MTPKTRSVEHALARRDGILVAFSGGVDSSLLLALAVRALPAERVLAVTATGAVSSEDDMGWARSVATALAVPHRIISVDYLALPGFAANPRDRCYLCRRSLYASLEIIRAEAGLEVIVDGALAADSADYRPGLRAAAEAGVWSPLAEAGLTKDEVRLACRTLGMAVAERPASPCLASRFPYGEPITGEALAMVAGAESFLHRRGFPVVRVRHHGRLARVEVPSGEVARLTQEPLRSELVKALRGLGYASVCVDLEGFRSGSLNEGLRQPADEQSLGRDPAAAG